MLAFFKKFCDAIKSRMWGLKKARNILRECLVYQLKEALYLELISKKVNVLIDFTEHSYYVKRDDEMIKGTNRGKGTKKMHYYLDFLFYPEVFTFMQDWSTSQKGNQKYP